MKVAVYTRVSTERQSIEGHSLEAQHDQLMKHLTIQGWELFRLYTDPGVSAKNLERPGVQEMIRDLKNGYFDAVLVHKLDRLTRNISDLYDLVELVNQKGVKLISLSEQIDTSSPMGRMFVYLLGIFAQMYRENLSQEIIKGMTKRAEKGLHNISVDLYGYRRDDEGDLHIVEEQAKWVQYIYDRYCAGIGSSVIAKELNIKNIRRNQGARWDQHKVMNTLTNMHYIGNTHWKVANAPESERIVRSGQHEAIISNEQYERVQRILERRREGTISRSSQDYVFSGILKCGECGGTYISKYIYNKNSDGTKTMYRNYACRNHIQFATCSGPSISEIKMVKLLFQYFDFNNSFTTYDEQVAATGETNEREEIEQMLKQSEMKRARWQHAYGENLMSYDDFAARMREEMEKVKVWQEQLETVRPAMSSTISESDALATLNTIKENWDDLDQDVKKQIMQHLFQRIVIKKTGKEWNITECVLA